jgi:hypothetical protein
MALRVFKPQILATTMSVYDLNLGKVANPNQRGFMKIPGVFAFAYHTNSRGFRGEREYREGKSGKYRVLLLGDSFTFGYGVNDDQVLSYKIEENLLKKKISAEVINAGNIASATEYALKFFNKIGYKFYPDLVVLCFFNNDFFENIRADYYVVEGEGVREVERPFSNDFIAKKDFLRSIPLYQWLISHSHLASLLKYDVSQVIYKYIIRPGKRPQFSPECEWTTRILLRNLRESVRDADAGFAVFYVPLMEEVVQYRQTQKVSEEERALFRILEREDIANASFTPLLAQNYADIHELYYRNPDIHWTARAHSLVGDYLGDYIERQIAMSHK